MIKWNDLKKIKIQTNKTALGHDHMMISLFISGDNLLFSDLQSCDQYQPDRIKYDVAHWQANGAFRHTIYVYTGCLYHVFPVVKMIDLIMIIDIDLQYGFPIL